VNEDAARETVEHLQNAAVEMIRATRAFLDLLEELVEDAGPLVGLAAQMAAKGRAAASPQHSDEASATPVQHIRVS